MPAKPIPKKWVIPVGVAVALAAILILRKKKASASSATEPGAEGLTNQAFVPVAGEHVAGVGAGNYGGTGENQGFIMELLKGNQESQRESSKEFQEYIASQNLQARESQEAERNFLRDLITNLGTGGGAPSTPAGVGVTPAPPPQTQPAPSPPPPPAPAPPPPPAPKPAGCPADFPNRGAHGCWRWSRTKTGAGCSCHGYQNGVLECEHMAGGRCTW